MKRRTVVALLIVTLFTVGAWECGGSKSQCENGSFQTRTKHGKTTYYECVNNEWVKCPEAGCL